MNHRKGTKIEAAKAAFKRNLPILPKSGPTAFRKRVLHDIQSETGATTNSAPGLYNQAKNEAIEAGLIEAKMLERGSGGRGLKLDPDYPWTAVLPHNTSPVCMFESKAECEAWAKENGYAVKRTVDLIRARERALAA